MKDEEEVFAEAEVTAVKDDDVVEVSLVGRPGPQGHVSMSQCVG